MRMVLRIKIFDYCFTVCLQIIQTAKSNSIVRLAISVFVIRLKTIVQDLEFENLDMGDIYESISSEMRTWIEENFIDVQLAEEGQPFVVYLGSTRKDALKVILKVIKADHPETFNQVKKGLVNHTKVVNHGGVARIVAYHFEEKTSETAYAVEHGDTLETKLKDGTIYTAKDIQDMVAKVADTLNYAKSKFYIAHNDLKPSSILIIEGKYKITDWVHSTRHERLGSYIYRNTTQEDYLYAPPEKLSIEKPEFSGDMYSLGLVCLKLLSLNDKELKQVRDCPQSLYEDVIEDTIAGLPTKNGKLRSLIYDMLRYDPWNRIKTEELCRRLAMQPGIIMRLQSSHLSPSGEARRKLTKFMKSLVFRILMMVLCFILGFLVREWEEELIPNVLPRHSLGRRASNFQGTHYESEYTEKREVKVGNETKTEKKTVHYETDNQPADNQNNSSASGHNQTQTNERAGDAGETSHEQHNNSYAESNSTNQTQGSQFNGRNNRELEEIVPLITTESEAYTTVQTSYISDQEAHNYTEYNTVNDYIKSELDTDSIHDYETFRVVDRIPGKSSSDESPAQENYSEYQPELDSVHQLVEYYIEDDNYLQFSNNNEEFLSNQMQEAVVNRASSDPVLRDPAPVASYEQVIIENDKFDHSLHNLTKEHQVTTGNLFICLL